MHQKKKDCPQEHQLDSALEYVCRSAREIGTFVPHSSYTPHLATN